MDARLGCGNGEVNLSNNRTLAPLDMVQASKSLDNIGASATRIYSSGATWCTDNNDPNPYIDLQFTSPVLISMMLSRGSIGTRLNTGIIPSCSLRMFHVTNFTLEYSTPDNLSVLNYYNIIPESAAILEDKNLMVS